MSNTIKIKNSGTPSSVPISLEYGEIAINYADKKLFYKDSNNSILNFDLSTNLNIDAGFAQADIYEAEVTNVITVFYDGGQI
jgi:hypothetical protein